LSELSESNPSGLSLTLREVGFSALAWNTILSGTPDEIIIYANDAETVAEVSQGAGNPDALNNYIWLLLQCSNNSATVGVWKLTDVPAKVAASGVIELASSAMTTPPASSWTR